MSQLRATHATGVVDLTARAARRDRQQEAERLAEDLNAAIKARHDAVHRRGQDIYECGDFVCSAWAQLMTAVS